MNKASRPDLSPKQQGELSQLGKDLLVPNLPQLIGALVDGGFLDENRLNDHDHVGKTLRLHLDEALATLTVEMPIDEEFLEGAKKAIESGSHKVAVILIATTLEHILNRHHDEALSIEQTISTADIRKALEQNLNAKTGWLISLLGGELSQPLVQQVKHIFQIRNKLVHFKPQRGPMAEPDSWRRPAVVEMVQSLDFEAALNLPAKLEQELDEILDVRWPQRRVLRDAAAKLVTNRFEGKPPGTSS